MLKIPVIVGKVNNLSDARYCAAMGVEMIGYCCNQSDKRYVSVDLINAMVGWTAGIKTLLEFGNQPENEIISIINNIKPQAIMLPMSNITDTLKSLGIILIGIADTTEINSNVDYIAYSININNKIKSNIPSFISGDFNKENIETILLKYNPFGIYLEGGDELKPGIKTFDELQEIFEILEE